MKNSTKIRLRLSKQLFESLATQVLAEAKKDAMSGGAYTEAVKTPKAKSEAPKAPTAPKKEKPQAPKSHKPVKKEAVHGEKEGTVTVTLDEVTIDDTATYELGKWVADNWPAIADALESTAKDPQQQLVDLGGQVLSLATIGTVALSAGLAVAKDSIVAAAKKVKEKLTGKKGAVAEGEDDGELDQILAKIPADKKVVK